MRQEGYSIKGQKTGVGCERREERDTEGGVDKRHARNPEVHLSVVQVGFGCLT